MARGICIDCNYEGALNAQGDCPRCGSDWTDGSAGEHRRDEDQLDGLLSARTASVSTDTSELDYYQL